MKTMIHNLIRFSIISTVFVLSNCITIHVHKNPKQIDFKNLNDKVTLFKNYLSILTKHQSLTDSIWAKISYHEGKSIDQFR